VQIIWPWVGAVLLAIDRQHRVPLGSDARQNGDKPNCRNWASTSCDELATNYCLVDARSRLHSDASAVRSGLDKQ